MAKDDRENLMFVNDKQRFFQASDLICLCIIMAAMYLLMPRFWEPCAETWKYWMSARILKDTGGFPVIYYGPLYIAYLQFFLLFDFPLSFQMEYFVTHFFCYTTIFFLLRSMIARVPALLLLCAWIPIIATIEGSTVVAGMGFMALYLCQMLKAHGKTGIIPPSLAAAALCHTSYVPFFIGHIFGSVVKLWRDRRLLKDSWKNVVLSGWMINAALLVILILTLLFPSQRWDHNYLQMDQKYVPVPMSDPLTLGFFMAGNHRYVIKNEPKAEWIKGDWYFTHEKAYAGAATILQAVARNPLLVVINLGESMKQAINLPLFFMFGNYLTNKFGGLWLSVISWLILFLAFYGMGRRFIASDNMALACSLTVGIVAVVAALFLVWFGVRYQIVLLPVMFFVFSHIGPGYHDMEKRIFKNIPDKYLQPVSGNGPLLPLCGVFILLSGLFLNERTLSFLIPVDRPLLGQHLFDVLMICSLNLVMILAGVFIIVKAKPGFFMAGAKIFFRKTGTVVCALAVVMIGTALYANVKTAGIRQALGPRYLLTGSKPVSIMNAHQEIMANLNRHTKVLSQDETWIKAFTNVNLDNVYHMYFLPPFPDSSEVTEKSLDELNMILVNDEWSGAHPSVATQAYLRYHLHVEPFLKKALRRGWTVKEIEGYGRMYLKTRETY